VYIGKEHHQEGGNVVTDIRNKWAEVFVYEQNHTIEDIPYTKHETFAVLSQTTLNFSYVEKILKEMQIVFPWAKIPAFSDVCKATYERQTVVLKNLDKFDAFIVIWGKESNNTKELYNLWIKNGKKSFFGESLNDILAYGENEILTYETIAITWWASTPIEDIREVFEYYKIHGYTPKIIQLTTND
jgi:4-hydroxy-3-methylbut-2-enyl diphosphate reductase IspH